MVLRYFLIFVILSEANVDAEFIAKCHSPGITEAVLKRYYRISPNSKYMCGNSFHNEPAPEMESYQQAAQYCKDRDMELARITSIHDFKSISKFLIHKDRYTTGEFDILMTQYWVSGTDEDEEGLWTYQDKKNITFQQFYGWGPYDSTYTNGALADYMVLINAKDTLDSGKFGVAMLDRNKKEGEKYLHFSGTYKNNLCQYKRSNICFKESDEEKANKELTDDLVAIGKTETRKYFITKIQKTWHQAREFCASQSKSLLDLSRSTELKDLYKILRDWLLDNDLMATTNAFIMNGQETELFEGDSPAAAGWEWLDDKLLDQRVDSVVKQKLMPFRRFGRCLSVGTLFTKSTVFSLARSLCNLPYWCVCYEDFDSPVTENPGGKITTEDPEGSTTEDPDPGEEGGGGGGGSGGDYEEDESWVWHLMAV